MQGRADNLISPFTPATYKLLYQCNRTSLQKLSGRGEEAKEKKNIYIVTNSRLISQGALKQELHHKIGPILRQRSHIFVPWVNLLERRVISHKGGLPFGQRQTSREGGSYEPLGSQHSQQLGDW